MSTKIYNAFKVKGGFETVEKIRERLCKIVEVHVKQHLSSDKEINEEMFVDGKIPYRFIKKFQDLYETKEPIILFNIEEKLKPYEYLKSVLYNRMLVYYYKKHFYIQVFSRLPYQVFDNLVKDGLMVDYHYQDQVDPYYNNLFVDKKIDKKEYQRLEREYRYRGKIWDGIFRNSSIPRDVSYEYNLLLNGGKWYE